MVNQGEIRGTTFSLSLVQSIIFGTQLLDLARCGAKAANLILRPFMQFRGARASSRYKRVRVISTRTWCTRGTEGGQGLAGGFSTFSNSSSVSRQRWKLRQFLGYTNQFREHAGTVPEALGYVKAIDNCPRQTVKRLLATPSLTTRGETVVLSPAVVIRTSEFPKTPKLTVSKRDFSILHPRVCRGIKCNRIKCKQMQRTRMHGSERVKEKRR